MSQNNPFPHEWQRLSVPDLLAAAEHHYWQCLAGDSHARAVLESVRQELGQALFRAVLLRIVRSVVAARRKVDRSDEFRSAKRLRKLLWFITKHTLVGESVKQELLAVEVFKRRNLGVGAVSTEIRRLRETLEKYYQRSGLADPIRLWIPKGKYVAIVTRVSADAQETFPAARTEPVDDVRVVPLNGLPGLSVFPAFSPTSDRIAFSWNHNRGGYAFDVFVQPIDAPAPLQITSGGGAADISPAWSPDGRRIAFIRVSLGRSEILVTSPTPGDREQKLADVFPIRYEILGRQLAWMRDGKALVIADKPERDIPFAIFRLALETGTMGRLTQPPAGMVGDSDPAFSPNGNALAFVRTEAVGVKDVFVLPAGADAPIRLTFDRKHLHGLAWLPDSSGILFSSARERVPRLWRVGLAGGPPERLSGLGERALYPACSPDTSCLAYTNLVMSTSIWQLQLAGADEDRPPTAPKKMLIYSTRNDINPDFSPDGSKIAFASDRSGAFEIWICDRAGRNPSKITSYDSPAGAGTPRWSPDGTRVAFDCRAEGHGHIYVVTLATGRVLRVTRSGSENVVPSWSADGRSIYFSSNRSARHEVWRAPSEGGEPVQLTQSGGFAPIESPDGKFVYYARSRTASGLWRLPLGGGAEELVLEALKPTFWGLWVVANDGIYFLDSAPDGPPPCTLKFLRFQTGSISELTVLDGVTLVHYQGLAISPDRQHLLYPQLDQSAGEIMLAKRRPLTAGSNQRAILP